MSQLRGHFQPEQILQRFAIRRTQLQGLREIGYGVGVTVETAIWTKSNGQREEVVMKKYHLRSDSTQYKRSFHREVKVLSDLNHRNIVQFYGFCDDGILAIVMEKAECSLLIGGFQKICHSLKDILGEYKSSNEDLPFSTKAIALHQICKGLKYLHGQGIVHNDLKSANVLVFRNNDNRLIFKICDFGECRRELIDTIRSGTSDWNPSNCTEAKKTAPYISPERFKDSLLTNPKCDIYALAMLMYELLRPELDFPWQEELGRPIYNEIEKRVLNGERPGFQGKNSFRTHLDEDLEKIIEFCWQQDPEDRPDIDQVLDLVSFLNVKGDKERFLHEIEDDYLKSIYEKLFDHPSLAYDFVKEVSKWNKDTIVNLTRYFDELIVALRSREKKFNAIDLASDAAGAFAGLTGIVGFALLFTPFTFIPGVVLCATAGAVGASGGIANGSVMIHKNRKDKQAKEDARAEFKKAGIDMDAFAKLLKEIYDVSQDLSKDFESIDQEYIFGAIHGFLLRVWGLLQEIATIDLVMQDIQGLENDSNNASDSPNKVVDHMKLTYNILTSVKAEAITGASLAMTIKSIYQAFDPSAVGAANTFSALAKSAQVLRSVGLVFSILGLGAGIYGMAKNSIKIHKGSENDVAEMLGVYKTYMHQFWRIKVIVQPNLDE